MSRPISAAALSVDASEVRWHFLYRTAAIATLISGAIFLGLPLVTIMEFTTNQSLNPSRGAPMQGRLFGILGLAVNLRSAGAVSAQPLTMMFRSQDLEMGAIIHLGPNTFHSWRDVEPSDGFHPQRKSGDLIANFRISAEATLTGASGKRR